MHFFYNTILCCKNTLTILLILSSSNKMKSFSLFILPIIYSCSCFALLMIIFSFNRSINKLNNIPNLFSKSKLLSLELAVLKNKSLQLIIPSFLVSFSRIFILSLLKLISNIKSRSFKLCPLTTQSRLIFLPFQFFLLVFFFFLFSIFFSCSSYLSPYFNCFFLAY